MRLFRRRHTAATQADTMLAIRSHLAAFGFDLSDYTDEEIQAAVVRFGEISRAAMFTMQEAADALGSVCDALNADKG